MSLLSSTWKKIVNSGSGGELAAIGFVIVACNAPTLFLLPPAVLAALGLGDACLALGKGTVKGVRKINQIHQRKKEARRQQEERERQERNRPIPPTREALAADARKRYEETLRLLETAQLDEVENQAARRQAQQQYLRVLDGLMR